MIVEQTDEMRRARWLKFKESAIPVHTPVKEESRNGKPLTESCLQWELEQARTIIIHLRHRVEEQECKILSLQRQIGDLENVYAGDESSEGCYKKALAIICGKYNIRPAELLSSSRTPAVVMPRHILMWLIKRNTVLSFPNLGKLLGRDHSTAMHGVSKINKMREIDPVFCVETDELERALNMERAP